MLWDTMGSNRSFMHCDSRQQGMKVAALCEWSKAYVRCFGLLALVISLMCASHMLLHQRVYYLLLKRNALLRIQKASPSKQTLLWILLFCFSQAVLHLLLNIATDPNQAGPLQDLLHYILVMDVQNIESSSLIALQGKTEEAAELFIVPSALFLVFLWESYDIDSNLIPLSKFFGDDPCYTQKMMESMVFIEEEDASIVAHSDLHEESNWPPDHKGPRWSEDEVFSQFIAKAKHCNYDKSSKIHLNNYVLLSSFWPSRLILDPRLQGTEGESSRMMVSIWSVPCIMLMAFAIHYTLSRAMQEAVDVAEGQYEDILGLLVLLATAMLSGYLLFVFVSEAFLPFDIFPALRQVTGGRMRI